MDNKIQNRDSEIVLNSHVLINKLKCFFLNVRSICHAEIFPALHQADESKRVWRIRFLCILQLKAIPFAYQSRANVFICINFEEKCRDKIHRSLPFAGLWNYEFWENILPEMDFQLIKIYESPRISIGMPKNLYRGAASAVSEMK